MTSPARAVRSAPRRAPGTDPGLKAPRPSLRVVPAPTRRAGAGLVLTLSTVVVFAALVVSAVAHSFLVSGQAELDRVATEVRAQREGLEVDRVVLAANQSPQRIAEEAQRLGMVPADTQTWISPGTGAPPVVVGKEGTEISPALDDETPPTVPERSSAELASAPPTGGARP